MLIWTWPGTCLYNGDVHVCPNGEYQQKIMFEILEEVLTTHPFDGVFCNMSGFLVMDYSGNFHGLCHCDSCKKKYLEIYGTEMPETDDLRNPAFIGKYMQFTGRCTAEHKARMKALGMKVIGYDCYDMEGLDYVDEKLCSTRGDKLETLLQKSDFIILCMALNDDTYHMLNAETLKQVKPGAFLVNMARGGLVDTPAMIEALENGRLGGAGLDVFEEQPLSPESPLWEMPTVYITPHTTPQVPDRDGRSIEIIRENAHRFEAGEPLMNLMRKSDMLSGEGHTSGFAAAMNANMKPNPQIIKMLEKHLGKRGWTDPSEWMQSNVKENYDENWFYWTGYHG